VGKQRRKEGRARGRRDKGNIEMKDGKILSLDIRIFEAK
jgi:hypothetical protein